MKGFKVTLPNGSAKHGTDKIIYAVGQEYKMLEDAVICKKGFHFCTKPADCFNYYDFDSNNLVFEVEALGNISTQVDEDSKVATNHLKVIRQIEWLEMLELCNEGKGNTGLRNTGDGNTGNRNTGNRNTGNRNTGYGNTGYGNTGDGNTGDYNTGYGNTGNGNTGNRNTGNRNTGNRNTGYGNTGYGNTGNRNTGNRNTGYGNTGIANKGDYNTGYGNTGNGNTGNGNTGYGNTGIANKGNRHTGAFCTGDATFTLFNKPTKMNYNEFISSKACYLLCEVETKKWIRSSEMTDEQKKSRPHHEVQEGMYIDIPFNVAFSEKWGTWTAKERREFTSLPNFDADIFFEITGVKI